MVNEEESWIGILVLFDIIAQEIVSNFSSCDWMTKVMPLVQLNCVPGG